MVLLRVKPLQRAAREAAEPVPAQNAHIAPGQTQQPSIRPLQAGQSDTPDSGTAQANIEPAMSARYDLIDN